MIQIKIDERYADLARSDLLRRAVEATLTHEQAPPGARLTVVVTDDEELRRLNEEYLGHNAATDVLSFPDGDPDPETGAAYLGDILIAFPIAASQAEAAGHPVIEELQLLVVHGVLHLLEHDHYEPGEKARMWAAQDAILTELGVRARPAG
ncbi:MAG: rRNA maturation RNase YbeY [Chloroflexi bacterium]|nr:rRNA maturation RNase YbeY [Chloroflexota bacterium]